MNTQPIHIVEREQAGAGVQASERWGPVWKCHTKAELFYPGQPTPFYTKEVDGNLLLNGGASLLFEYMRGNGSTSTANAKHYFNATAALGVGNSSVAASSFHKALQGTKLIKALSAGFPTHTTGSTASTASKIIYKSTFALTDANFTWWEWGVHNRITTGAPQRLLNRRVANLLTKTSAATASLTVTLSLG